MFDRALNMPLLKESAISDWNELTTPIPLTDEYLGKILLQ